MVGIEVVVALAAILCAEVYFDVVKVALDAGLVLLAFGIALDTCARALGTVAAGRIGSRPWEWGCALGGTPVVAAFALFRRSGPVTVEPAPLAGLLSVFAAAVMLISLLVWVLGS